jgi:predicted dehydrogenase
MLRSSPSCIPSASDAVAEIEPRPTPRAGIGRKTLRVGLLGCGAFARFSAAQYRQMPDVRIAAVADIDPVAARRAAAELGTEARSPDALLAGDDIDLVYIATPPALHHRQAAAALLAGKHVLVEKPLATTLADAEELETLATKQELVCVANLVERYNPLARAVHRLIGSRILGGLIHGLFINEAADEGLAREHWFWNRDSSGGIFVEHGVHFFDLVASWLGRGTVVCAARSLRPAAGLPAANGGKGEQEPVEEQVSCTCRYPADGCGDWLDMPPCGCPPQGGVLFHFEHGFHQPSRMDRQEMRLVFARGELQLFDWVPTHGVLKALVDEDTVGILARMLPGGAVCTVDRYAGESRHMRGRFQSFEATALVEITFDLGLSKLDLYAQVVRDLAADQIAAMRDPARGRTLTEVDSVAAVAMACEADRLALAGG